MCVEWWFAFVGICDDLQESALIELIFECHSVALCLVRTCKLILVRKNN